MIIKKVINFVFIFIKKKIILCKLKWKNRKLLSMAPTARITNSCLFEGCNAISSNSFFSGKMGYGSYISDNCHIEGEVGRFSSIAPGVKTHRGIHPVSYPYVSTSPMFFSLRKQNGHTFAKEQLFDEMKDPITIGNDCWICSNVFICGGVKIGDGAVIYAGAVVTKDVQPYTVVGGVPARFIKYRYDKETIDFLLSMKWWDRPIAWIKENWKLLNNIDALKKYESFHKRS